MNYGFRCQHSTKFWKSAKQKCRTVTKTRPTINSICVSRMPAIYCTVNITKLDPPSFPGEYFWEKFPLKTHGINIGTDPLAKMEISHTP